MDVYVKKIAGKKRGVFANRDFKKGELIEICPVVILDELESKKIDETALKHYVYIWNREPETYAICLGNGSIYNHSDNPNIEFEKDLDNLCIKFFATKDVAKDEELLHDYGWDGPYDWSEINKDNKYVN